MLSNIFGDDRYLGVTMEINNLKQETKNTK